MSASLRSSLCAPGLDVIGLKKKKILFERSNSETSVLKFEDLGNRIALSEQSSSEHRSKRNPLEITVHSQASVLVSRPLRWWDKNLKPNMTEIYSARELIDALKNAGDKLVIVDFFSPGCGGCRALHPKICQIAEANPEVQFLTINYEKLQSMCYSLHIHVLPFFRFYRGAEGRLCSFSCTNATIKKFKKALTKHGADRCSLGPAKGLEESELLSLVASRELPIDFLLRYGETEELAATSGAASDSCGVNTESEQVKTSELALASS